MTLSITLLAVPSVVMLEVDLFIVMLRAIMLRASMLNAVMLSVVAPSPDLLQLLDFSLTAQ